MSSKEQVKTFIDKEMKLQNLDQLFLFLTSILGIFFSLFYALFEYLETVIGFIPILIIGLIIPIYVGYIRGAILIDSLEERVRGWIYFIYGITVYIVSIVSLMLSKLLVVMNIEFETLSIQVSMVGSLIMSYYVGRGTIHRWFCRTIFDAFNGKITTLAAKIYKNTVLSAFMLGLFMYVSFQVSVSVVLDLSAIVTMILVASLGVGFFLWSEHDIRKWLCLLQFSEYIEIKEQRSKARIPSKIGVISAAISIILLQCLSITYNWLGIFWLLGLVAVSIIGQVIFFVSIGKVRYTFVRKKRRISKKMESELTKLLEQFEEN